MSRNCKVKHIACYKFPVLLFNLDSTQFHWEIQFSLDAAHEHPPNVPSMRYPFCARAHLMLAEARQRTRRKNK